MFDKNRSFLTPGGLKIRLDHRYFFYQLLNTDKHYTDEEILNNDVMYNATANIETMFLIPTMLTQIFTMVAIITHIDVLSFFVISAVLYAFGCMWRCSEQDILISTTLMFLTTVYDALRWLFYIALIVVTFVLGGAYLVIPYISMRILLYILSMIGNHISVVRTVKKYGIPFNDTEICAFRVFHVLSHSNLKFSDYIAGYVSAVKPPKKAKQE